MKIVVGIPDAYVTHPQVTLTEVRHTTSRSCCQASELCIWEGQVYRQVQCHPSVRRLRTSRSQGVTEGRQHTNHRHPPNGTRSNAKAAGVSSLLKETDLCLDLLARRPPGCAVSDDTTHAQQPHQHIQPCDCT